MKRILATLAIAGAAVAVSAAPASASTGDDSGGLYVCVRYTYVYVAGQWVPTVGGVAITSSASECDFAVGV